MTRRRTRQHASARQPLPIAQLLHAALPWLSTLGRAIVSALVATRGRPASAQTLAVWLGMRDRFQLARVLRREGLPSVRALADWICVLHFLLVSESSGQPLLRQAGDPDQAATDYRRVRRTLGVTWREGRSRGFAWALLRFRACCRPPRQLRDTAGAAAGVATVARGGFPAVLA